MIASSVANSVGKKLVVSIFKRAMWKAAKHLGGGGAIRFAPVTSSNTWAEAPDIGRPQSLLAERVTEEALVEYCSGGGRLPHTGKGLSSIVGGEIIIIPKSDRVVAYICEVNGVLLTKAERGEAIHRAFLGFDPKGLNARDAWLDFLAVVEENSHPLNRSEWDKYVASVHIWIDGSRKFGDSSGWKPPGPRLDENIPDHRLDASTTESLDQASMCACAIRTASLVDGKKPTSTFWNATQRKSGSLWKKGTVRPAKAVPSARKTSAPRDIIGDKSSKVWISTMM